MYAFIRERIRTFYDEVGDRRCRVCRNQTTETCPHFHDVTVADLVASRESPMEAIRGFCYGGAPSAVPASEQTIQAVFQRLTSSLALSEALMLRNP